jgi:hypothetical protein
MSGDPIRRFLRARGVAEHIVAGGIEGLMAAWEQTAAAIEAGYSLTLDDYLNDLDARQILEIVLRAIPHPDGPLLDRLRAADARVRAATVPARQCIWGDGGERGWTARRNWWYFVVPRAPGPDLADDLAREGFGVDR